MLSLVENLFKKKSFTRFALQSGCCNFNQWDELNLKQVTWFITPVLLKSYWRQPPRTHDNGMLSYLRRLDHSDYERLEFELLLRYHAHGSSWQHLQGKNDPLLTFCSKFCRKYGGCNFPKYFNIIISKW